MIRTKSKLILLISLLVILPNYSFADSLWGNKGSLYGVKRQRIQVGDIITIQISESTSAVQQASTNTKKDSSVGANMLNNWDQVANLLGNETIRKTFDFSIGGEDEYQGTGQTSRRSNVKAIVTSIVTEILESGNLFVVGEHKVKVNNEVETVRVSGIIRPEDISGRNTVFSYQIAKAQVSVNGSGVVAAKQTPGIVSKLFNWIF
ncbi:hypothetical protein DID75_01850 [Candidatus Marinamargulisbacteria bacterium SCGC AG-410-N11]|nr:hypothetical protein DID75_01850 [Candidatus Marinamargulisbacteria bacterium SCGC AG-410-N11]